jgi:hypothetical protein
VTRTFPRPLRRAGDNAAPILAPLQAIADTLLPWVDGRGPIAETDRREIARGVLLRMLAALSSEGSPRERLEATLQAPGRTPSVRAVLREAFCVAATASPFAPWEEVARLADLLAPAT